MEWPIFTIVSGDATCIALLGSDPTRLWEDAVPEEYHPIVKPYSVWSTVGGSPENYLYGVPTMDSGRLQVDVYGTSKSSAFDVAIAIRNAVEPHAHMISVPVSLYEPETKLYRYILQFQFWTLRPEPSSV